MALDRDGVFKDAFADLATQYYVAARLAARMGLTPVHAVERDEVAIRRWVHGRWPALRKTVHPGIPWVAG